MKMGYKPDAGLCLHHPEWKPLEWYYPSTIVFYGGRTWLCIGANFASRPDTAYSSSWKQYDRSEHESAVPLDNPHWLVAPRRASRLCALHADWSAMARYALDDVAQYDGVCWVLCDEFSLTSEPPSETNGWRPFLHEGDETVSVDRLDMLEF